MMNDANHANHADAHRQHAVDRREPHSKTRNPATEQRTSFAANTTQIDAAFTQIRKTCNFSNRRGSRRSARMSLTYDRVVMASL